MQVSDYMCPTDSHDAEHPNAWDLELSSNSEGDEDEENEDSEGENDTPKPQATTSTSPVSHAFQEFLGFLELGCSGSPLQGYPAIIIILSTISPAVCILPSVLIETYTNVTFVDFCHGPRTPSNLIHILLGCSRRPRAKWTGSCCCILCVPVFSARKRSFYGETIRKRTICSGPRARRPKDCCKGAG